MGSEQIGNASREMENVVTNQTGFLGLKRTWWEMDVSSDGPGNQLKVVGGSTHEPGDGVMEIVQRK